MTADTKPGGRDGSVERAVTPQVDRDGEADDLLVWRHGGRIDGGLPVRAEAETLRVDSWKPARSPGGERSPWKERAVVHWQRWWPQRTRQRSKASRSRVAAKRHRQRCTERRHDDEGATATAMWCGCWRGDFFEGCMRAVGEASDRPDLHRPQIYQWVLPPGSGGVAAGGGNTANPFRYRDATSLEPHSRRKPSRWCETMRAERVVRSGIRATDGGGNVTRSGRERGISEEGSFYTIE